jgi:hypothetical protein
VTLTVGFANKVWERYRQVIKAAIHQVKARIASLCQSKERSQEFVGWWDALDDVLGFNDRIFGKFVFGQKARIANDKPQRHVRLNGREDRATDMVIVKAEPRYDQGRVWLSERSLQRAHHIEVGSLKRFLIFTGSGIDQYRLADRLVAGSVDFGIDPTPIDGPVQFVEVEDILDVVGRFVATTATDYVVIEM